MPIYEYQCSACGHRLEAIQRFSDSPLSECPECGQERLKKLISVAGFRLSGKGWYETDFKNSKQKNLSQKDSAEEKSAKPAEASDSKSSKEAKKPAEASESKASKEPKKETKPAKSDGAAASSAGN